MSKKMASPNRSIKRPARRGPRGGTLLGAALILSLGLLWGCNVQTQPTPTATKPAAAATAPPATAKPAATTAPAASPAAKEQQPATKPAQGSPVKLQIAGTTGVWGFISGVIKNQKIDLKYGQDWDIKQFEPADAERAVALKRLDMGPYSPLSAATAANEGVPIMIIAPGIWVHAYWVVPQDSPYTSPMDLKGKKIAAPAKITGVYIGAQVYFKEMGMDFEKDFQIVTGPGPAIQAFLEKRDVDAALLFEPFPTQMLARGGYKVIGSLNEMWKAKTGEPMMSAGEAVHRDWYNANKSAAQNMTKIILEGTNYIQAHPETLDQFKDVIGLKTAEEVTLGQKRILPHIPTKWDDQIIANTRRLIERAVELGVVAKMPADPILALP